MRHRLRVVRAHLLGWVGLARLALAIARRRVDEVWIGESNAVMLVMAKFPALGLGTADGRRWAWHLGPRLMFSIARDDFPPGVRRAVGLLRFVPGVREVTWFFNLGEIDIRCHLAKRVQDDATLPFVDDYVAHVQSLVSDLGGTEAVVVVPVPPAVEAFIHESFPIVGTLEERLAVHRLMRRRIIDAVQAAGPRPRLRVLDLTDRLSDESGYFRPELTSDGVHPNDAGRREARGEVTRLLQQA
jgi:hypothetical protein